MRSLSRRNIERRRYKAPGPNAVWHIDGYHKLVRWGIFIHGAIDGFSRLVIFLHASNNNRSSTVLDLFLCAATEMGTPSRIRVDHGVENVDICQYMEEKRGWNRGSALRGKSCHNQRIERLWVDVWEGVANEYHDLFMFLEEKLVLDITDLQLMELVHAVFLPRINASLKTIIYQYNNHGLSTEHYKTPNELFISGVLQNINSNSTAVKDLVDDQVDSGDNQPGDRTVPDEDNQSADPTVPDEDNQLADPVVPEQNNQPREEQNADTQRLDRTNLVAAIKARINILEKSSDVAFGATLFLQTKQIAQAIMERDAD